MTSRHWTGLCKKEHAYNYITHLKTNTIPQLEKIEGFIEAAVLHRELTEGIEFLVTTTWEHAHAIKEFAGEDIHQSVVPEHVKEMMIRYDDEVRHYCSMNIRAYQ